MITTTTMIEPAAITDETTREMILDALSVVTTAAKAYQLVVDDQGCGMARQGDVLLRRVGNMPPSLKDKKPKQVNKGQSPVICLVRGENGGNTHALASSNATYVEVEGNMNIIGYLNVGNESVLRHEEHGPIIVPSGTYEVRRQVQGSQWQDRVSD